MFGIPTEQRNCDIQRFTSWDAGAGGANLWSLTWKKPKGCAMGYFWGLSGGAGGGGGHTAAPGNARGGGGGGGGGAVFSLLVPLIFLPDRLYVLVGRGGPGGAATVDGTAGGPTMLSVYQGTDASNLLMFCSGSQAQPGLKGTAVAAGTGGAGGTATTVASMSLAQLGLFQTYGGQAGKNGGVPAGAIGTAATIVASAGIAMGGAGGAGVTAADFAGGTFTTIAASYISQQLSAAHAAGSVAGPGGIIVEPPDGPLWCISGGGGSSSNAGVGGAGGNSPLGSGGGGGGGGTTGGKGGDGGNGALVSICW